MKSKLRQALYLWIGIGAISVFFTGCEKKDIYEPGRNKVTINDYFDFSTNKMIPLNVSYSVGGKVLFEVYGANPMKVVDGMVQKDTSLIALAKGITDENGNYNLKACIPTSLEEVYIYSPSFGAPALFKTRVSGSEISAKIDFESAIDLTSMIAVKSRATSGSIIMNNIPNRLSSWNSSGLPTGLDNSAKLKVDQTMRKYITTYLPEGGGNGVYKAYISDNSDITIYEDASEVSINYLGGETSAQSVFAYYCYPENATVDQIRQAAANACVVFPSAHAKALGAYSGVAMNLKYINPAGKLVEGNFPKGTRIGFLLWNNGWVNSAFTKNSVFYSTKALNADGVSHTVLLGIKDDAGKQYNAIGFEDWTPDDYNDVVFVISSTPAEAIVVPPTPEPEPETYTETYQGILGFEDCWPNQGDYDMNDVVVKYNSNVTCNEKNEILSITDKFTLSWSGANFRNGFGYQFPFNMEGKKVVFSGKGSISGNVVILFSDAKKELNVEGVPGKDMPSANPQEVAYVVTTIFDVPMSKEGIVPPYNSFITINGSKNEVHLTGYKPTPEATNQFPAGGADISDGVSTWFICEDGFPFAIHMDARKDPSLLNLNLKPENIRIDKTYPGFAKWAETRDPQIKWW